MIGEGEIATDDRDGPGTDWRQWRRERRRALIEQRRGLEAADRRARNRAIDAALEAGFAPLGGHTVGFCWPFAAEPEPRFAVRRWRAQGSTAALPVVVAPRTPLTFRAWWPGAPMARGVYDIPYPTGTPTVTPAAVLVPVNGFDEGGYRLGYGGGYFDRTLAAVSPRPLTIGLGYELGRLASIDPQPHDIPFDFIVTEAGIHLRDAGRLRRVEPAAAAERAHERLEAGGVPG